MPKCHAYRMLGVDGAVPYTARRAIWKKRGELANSGQASPGAHPAHGARDGGAMEFGSASAPPKRKVLFEVPTFTGCLRLRFQRVLLRDDNLSYTLVTGDHDAPALVSIAGLQAQGCLLRPLPRRERRSAHHQRCRRRS